MAKKTKYKLGQAYRVKWFDHYNTSGKELGEALSQKTVFISRGRCEAITPKYLVLATSWEYDGSGDNDRIHIIKKCIMECKEIQ